MSNNFDVVPHLPKYKGAGDGLVNHLGDGYDDGEEPRIDDMMSDDTIKSVMACDGVEAEQLQSLMALVRTHLR
jgi:hypothetical protein